MPNTKQGAEVELGQAQLKLGACLTLVYLFSIQEQKILLTRLTTTCAS